MFLNKFNQSKLTDKNIRTAKYIYDSNLIIKSLKKKFVLIYYYDFISKEQESQLKTILNENNLKLIKVKKNLLILYFRRLKLRFMLNIIQNNTFLIINKNNDPLKRKVFSELNSIKNMHLLGSWLNYKFLRPSQVKKLSTISKKSINVRTIKILSLNKNYIQKSIIFKKFN